MYTIWIYVTHTHTHTQRGKMPLKIPIVAYIQQFIPIILLVCGLANVLGVPMPTISPAGNYSVSIYSISSHFTHRYCCCLLLLLIFSLHACVRAYVLHTIQYKNTIKRNFIRPLNKVQKWRETHAAKVYINEMDLFALGL